MNILPYLWYATKNFFYNLYVVLLNGCYWWRFYCKARRGKFNRDFSNKSEKEDWTITFQDEFEGTEVNFNNGTWNEWFSKNQMSSNNACDYSLDCINVRNNKLYLTTKKNNDNNGFPLKTGILNSSGDSNWKQQFGYFETCCKVPPNGLTFWSAFWLYGNTWPPEIDIFEFMSDKDVDTDHSKGISMTTHWGTPNKKDMAGKSTQLGRMLRRMLGASVNFDKHFHTYAIRWEYNYIEWYIDNIPVYRTVYNIPNNEMSIIINNGGNLDNLPKDEQLPQDFIVDYVRAYKKTSYM